MKFIISREELNYLLSKCLSVISAKPAMPILSHVLIEAAHGELKLTATDLTVGIQCTTDVKVLEEGKASLPAKRFANLIRELTAYNIEISVDQDYTTHLICDSSHFKLKGMNPEDYPSLPDLSEAITLTLKQEELKDTLYRTAFSVCKDGSRVELSGVGLSLYNGRATFFGTDGKRLSRTFVSIEGLDQEVSENYILPIKAVDEIIKSIGGDESVTVLLMEDKIAVKTENFTLVSKLITEKYPDLTRIIPDVAQTQVHLHREELMTLLRQVSLFAIDSGESVRFTFSGGEVKLKVNSSDVGEGNVSMPVDYHGEPIDIAFNPAFFLDILRHSKQERITLGLTDSFSPGVLLDGDEGKSTKDASPLFILMPLRLNPTT